MNKRRQKFRQKARKERQSKKKARNVQQCQQSFEEALPRIVRHCQVQFRNIKCQSAREELTAEACGLAWKWWCRLVEKGRDPTQFISAIATFAVKAARSGRRVCGQDAAKDVMSPRAQQGKGFAVCSLPAFATLSSNPFAEALHDNTKTPVDDQVAFRLDFPAWLGGFDAHKREVIDLMVNGERTTDIAEKVGKSAARISQLRLELFLSWELFIGEEC
jgi:hypothetical protein